MKKHKISDEKILDILRKDSQKGMVLLMEKYTGLVWHVISFYVENPEDIKECVNDVFTKFYLKRKEYDKERASLSVYLTAVARRTAISCYRREKGRRAEEIKEEPAEEDSRLYLAELKADMERALLELKPGELQIIRMKYYDGMTVREIADSLKLPYETVKKRHQRTIMKLSGTLLLILLILSSLTVCAYGILRFFDIIPPVWEWEREPEDTGEESADPERRTPTLPDRRETKPLFIEEKKEEEPGKAKEPQAELQTENAVSPSAADNYMISPGYGINLNPEEPLYSLSEKVYCEINGWELTLEEVVYLNNQVTVTLLIHSKTEILDKRFESVSFPFLIYGGETWERYDSQTMRINEYTEKRIFNFKNVVLPVSEQGVKGLTLKSYEFRSLPDIVFDMLPVKQETIKEYFYQTGVYGGVLAVPRLENGELIIAVYPMDNGSEYRILPSLIRDSYGNKEGEVTVTKEDGTVLAGTCPRYHPVGMETYYEWYFGAAGPGSYTLNIPYLYQDAPAGNFAIPVNMEADIWDGSDFIIPGGSIRIRDSEFVDRTSEEGMKIPDFKCEWVNCRRVWLEYRSDNQDREIIGCHRFSAYADELITEGERHMCESCFLGLSVRSNDVEKGILEVRFTLDTAKMDPDSACLRFDEESTVLYRWNQSFHIPFTVNE
ncbi:MAG: sigma-70 family RNA polymerase sigma factor [Lachnospiraceae bacterium]